MSAQNTRPNDKQKDSPSPSSSRRHTRSESNSESDHAAAEPQHHSGQPVVNPKARTHPLGGAKAKWKGVPLNESYQEGLDNNQNRQLGLGDKTEGQMGQVMREAQPKAQVPSAGKRIKRRIRGVGKMVAGGLRFNAKKIGKGKRMAQGDDPESD
ncbi:hypothetical protein CCMSSC00406_0003662 [Pleurotus cornucopiae]|uniref:Uncharacterized protein n=1 Tax=Pleurotus cornucopiae TaxID=5321 RepID=A0ACB7IHJ0_PLECO|nr:hypothetical protein CCMSSC00406_0003662 [Pleurotus cornucopiae]